jgi:hypothetical protein
MHAMAQALEEIVSHEFPGELELFRRQGDELARLSARGFDVRWLGGGQPAMFAVMLYACGVAARALEESEWSIGELERRLVASGVPAEVVERLLGDLVDGLQAGHIVTPSSAGRAGSR